MRVLVCSTFLLSLIACGKPAEAPPAAPPTPEESPAPASRIDEAQAFLDDSATGPNAGPWDADKIRAATELADALSQEDSDDAQRTAFQLRLLAVSKDLSQAANLGEADNSALAALTPELQKGSADALLAYEPILEAFRFMTGGAPPTDAAALRPLDTADTPFASAYRDVLRRYATDQLAHFDTHGVAPLIDAMGPLLCTDCTASWELQCDRLGDDDGQLCQTLNAASATDPAAISGPNAFLFAATTFGPEDGPSRLLPLAFPATSEALTQRRQPAALQDSPAQLVASYDEDGLRLGLRNALNAKAELISLKEGAAYRDATPLSAETLLAEATDDQPAAIPARLLELDAARDALQGWPTPHADAQAVLFRLDTPIPAETRDRVFDALLEAGIQHLQVLQAPAHGQAIPLTIRRLTEAQNDALKPQWSLPTLITVDAEQVAIWLPERAKDKDSSLGPEFAAELPESLTQAWAGETLRRLSFPTPEDPQAIITTLQETLKPIAGALSLDPILHLKLDDSTPAGFTEDLLVGLQTTPFALSDTLPAAATLWPTATCEATDDAPCPDTLIVAFSDTRTPSSRGLTPTPRKQAAAPAAPKKPAPSPEFCNQNDIRAQMTRRAGRFRFCYERELRLQTDLEGRVAMTFVIGMDGKPYNIRAASDTLKSPKVNQCLQQEIGKIGFAKPDGGECQVRWPFVFSSR